MKLERFEAHQFNFQIEDKHIKDQYRAVYEKQGLICNYHLEYGVVTRIDLTIEISLLSMIDFNECLLKEIREAAVKSNELLISKK